MSLGFYAKMQVHQTNFSCDHNQSVADRQDHKDQRPPNTRVKLDARNHYSHCFNGQNHDLPNHPMIIHGHTFMYCRGADDIVMLIQNLVSS